MSDFKSSWRVGAVFWSLLFVPLALAGVAVAALFSGVVYAVTVLLVVLVLAVVYTLLYVLVVLRLLRSLR